VADGDVSMPTRPPRTIPSRRRSCRSRSTVVPRSRGAFAARSASGAAPAMRSRSARFTTVSGRTGSRLPPRTSLDEDHSRPWFSRQAPGECAGHCLLVMTTSSTAPGSRAARGPAFFPPARAASTARCARGGAPSRRPRRPAASAVSGVVAASLSRRRTRSTNTRSGRTIARDLHGSSGEPPRGDPDRRAAPTQDIGPHAGRSSGAPLSPARAFSALSLEIDRMRRGASDDRNHTTNPVPTGS